MQNTDLQNYAEIRILVGRVLLVGLAWASDWASATRWANFQGTSRPVPMAERVVLVGRAWASGWARATSWASESEPETCIFELNWVVL
ncbi:hypothetical protein DEO72_LG10g3317 [Vigna unguiculata]|uniref:Uncharacterized protein n=1 Tax=Vigna unguiculata TaxID=3917 RepID=A0A4D6NJJ7_VIGUN|nr:hypothetical protein DEO72_LG10g3317 [Vigna unguiculata]